MIQKGVICEMKRFLKIILPILLALLLLSACTQGEFCNPELFLERFYEISGTEIKTENLIGTEDGDSKSYLFEAAEADEIKTVIKLFFDAQGRISECRVIISKLDKNGKPLLLTSPAKEAFLESAKVAACAFDTDIKEKVDGIFESLFTLDELGDSKTTERNAEYGHRRYVYLSNEVVSEVVIYNAWLCPAEETLKPESKAAFDKTTNVRTQTVPHK